MMIKLASLAIAIVVVVACNSNNDPGATNEKPGARKDAKDEDSADLKEKDSDEARSDDENSDESLDVESDAANTTASNTSNQSNTSTTTTQPDAMAEQAKQQYCANLAVAEKFLSRAEVDALLMAHHPGTTTSNGQGCFQYHQLVANMACNYAGYKQAVRLGESTYHTPANNYIYLWNGSTFVYWNASEADQWCLQAAQCQGQIDPSCL